MDVKKVDIVRMSKETGISEIKIRVTLGLDLPKITTVEEAREMYDNAPSTSAVTKALEKWNKLFLKEIEGVTTAKEAREMYDITSHNSKDKAKALRKIAEFYTY
ncbi:MAG: hypothetical protein U9R00_02070 [Patescibacteria group bacterium]|nr:hypothetical protein [Patescibacteria group bacterium]